MVINILQYSIEMLSVSTFRGRNIFSQAYLEMTNYPFRQGYNVKKMFMYRKHAQF